MKRHPKKIKRRRGEYDGVLPAGLHDDYEAPKTKTVPRKVKKKVTQKKARGIKPALGKDLSWLGRRSADQKRADNIRPGEAYLNIVDRAAKEGFTRVGVYRTALALFDKIVLKQEIKIETRIEV